MAKVIKDFDLGSSESCNKKKLTARVAVEISKDFNALKLFPIFPHQNSMKRKEKFIKLTTN
jgi:hypothetical protein